MNQLTSDFVQKSVTAALKGWYRHSSNEAGEIDLMSDFLLVQEELKGKANPSLPERRFAVNDVLLKALVLLKNQDEEAATVLEARYLNGQKNAAIAAEMYISEDTVGRRHKAGLKGLAEIILHLEGIARQTAVQEMEARLEAPTYTKLFGVDEKLETVETQLLQTAAPWILAVIGIGGLGKTALVDQLARRIISQLHFQRVIWIRVEAPTMADQPAAEQAYIGMVGKLFAAVFNRIEPLPYKDMVERLCPVLKEKPHLIFIDNMEDEAQIDYLIGHLHRLINPSKFVITSRVRPGNQVEVYNFSLEQLAADEAAALLRHHAQTRNLRVFTHIQEEDISAIYDLIGGNPYALKLVVNLLEKRPLADILTGLREGHTGSIEDMYRYIYAQSWEILSKNAQKILQMMPLISKSSGASPEQLQFITQLSREDFWAAIDELISHSLLEVRHHSANKLFYAIHRLTETFLTTHIINRKS